MRGRLLGGGQTRGAGGTALGGRQRQTGNEKREGSCNTFRWTGTYDSGECLWRGCSSGLAGRRTAIGYHGAGRARRRRVYEGLGKTLACCTDLALNNGSGRGRAWLALGSGQA